jgi:hypothetical protein
MKLEGAFEDFYDAIKLGQVPEGRIAEAWSRIHKYLIDHYAVPGAAVYLQGSYANDTTVEPLPGGEYDLDVVSATALGGISAEQAFADLTESLSQDADYKKRIDEEKQPERCLRLRYADEADGARFHIDVVPARASSSAPLEIPSRAGGWHDTDPQGFTAWCKSRGQSFTRTVRMLKRWRDENQESRRGIKSIVLQVLVAETLPSSLVDDADRIVGTFEGIKSKLAANLTSPPVISNPVLNSENLAERWPQESYASFRREIDDAVQLARDALDAEDEAQSHDLWRRLLGDDFPPAPTSPAKRQSGPPAPPAPGFESRPQLPPKRERYA